MADNRKNEYKTPQKSAILGFLKTHKDDFLNPEQIKEALGSDKVRSSLVTIYRFLDKLEEEGLVVRVYNAYGRRFLYRYIALDEKDFSHGKMICLRCGKILPLECSLLETFYEHVQKEHGCALDYKKTVLYCICPECLLKAKNNPAVSA